MIYSILALVFVLFALYLFHVNSALSSVPSQVLSLSPNRFDPSQVVATYNKLKENPVSTELPPKTGRRYIVVGGSGFLPGWIVIQLVARGENPRSIRIADIRAPTRQDLRTGNLTQVSFIKTDISDQNSVLEAFKAPWNDGREGDVPITVFHSAANIRFWERVKSLLHLSEFVNVRGTENIIHACRAVGADVLVYTSSASVTTHSNRFWLFPWQKCPERYIQILNDEAPIPPKHEFFFSNYAASKAHAERLVREAHKTPLQSQHGVLRTGCIRPGNGIYGPGGDILAGAYLVRKTNYTWGRKIIQSFVYVENCALAHLLYEQRILDFERHGPAVAIDIGGQAFNITDPNPPVTFGDVYTVLTTLTAETKFIDLPPVLMLIVAYLMEKYYLARMLNPFWSYILPKPNSELAFLQPSLFNLIHIHLIFDDSRARKSPKEGGLGYKAPWTTMEALCKLVIEWQRKDKREEERYVMGGQSSFAAGVETGWVQK